MTGTAGRNHFGRALLFILLGFACLSVSAQQTGAGPNGNRSQGAAQATWSFHLRGVLISPSGRSALVNGRLAEEGDRVGGARILAIQEGAVRILNGSRAYTVNVGTTFNPADAAGGEPFAAEVLEPEASQGTPGAAAPGPKFVASPAPARHRAVQPGETLSEIAQEYRGDSATLNQTMIALFQANTHAFNGNINLLYAGVTLRLPASDQLALASPEAADAEVARQLADWRPAPDETIRLAHQPDDSQYGPVANGETLSGIAHRVRPDGVTMAQMMMALFDANPRAFSDNIDVLYAGAVLSIPDTAGLHDPHLETATAYVGSEIQAWRPGNDHRARDNVPHGGL